MVSTGNGCELYNPKDSLSGSRLPFDGESQSRTQIFSSVCYAPFLQYGLSCMVMYLSMMDPPIGIGGVGCREKVRIQVNQISDLESLMSSRIIVVNWFSMAL